MTAERKLLGRPWLYVAAVVVVAGAVVVVVCG